MQVKHLLAVAVAAAILGAPFAIAAGEGDPIIGGKRNPSPNPRHELRAETQIIADNSTYGTRQSNKSNKGGAAIYGCRSSPGGTAANNEPCIRANNLRQGLAFEFDTDGAQAGSIRAVGGDNAKPFTTNATGVASGLNADRVDGFEGEQLAPSFAAVQANGVLVVARGATAAARAGVGNYTVDFNRDVSRCIYQATQINQDAGGASVEPVDADTLRVRIREGGGDHDYADGGFHLVVHC